MHAIHHMRPDIGEPFALLVDIEIQAGRGFGTPATSFKIWCTLVIAAPGSARLSGSGSPNTSGS